MTNHKPDTAAARQHLIDAVNSVNTARAYLLPYIDDPTIHQALALARATPLNMALAYLRPEQRTDKND